MGKAFKDAEFHREYKKLTGEDPDPITLEEMEKAIREMPRDAEVIDLLKNVSGGGPASRAITNCRNARPDDHLEGFSCRK